MSDIAQMVAPPPGEAPQLGPPPSMVPPGMPPTGMMQTMPAMIPNPAFAQWAQMAQGWIAEKQRRQKEFADACALIKSDAAKRFKIDIEADSTIAADEQAEKQARIEFLTAITPFLETILPQMIGNPALAPLCKELVLFAIRGFRVSRGLEDAFETALDALIKMSGQGQPGQQGGKNTKSPIEVATEAETAKGKQQTDMQANAVKLIQSLLQAQSDREKLEAEQQQHSIEMGVESRKVAGQEALEQARISHMAARDTAGLI